MDVGTSFGGIGSSREMMIASLAEPAMMHDRLPRGAGRRLDPAFHRWPISWCRREVGLRVSLGLALLALIMVAIAENARIPVDNPATHLELTMVHEAMVLEYSGRHLAMIELRRVSQTAALRLADCLRVLPLGHRAARRRPRRLAIGVGAYLVKLAVGGFLLALFETATAKMRVFRVPQFLGAALMLGLLGTLLLFVSRSF